MSLDRLPGPYQPLTSLGLEERRQYLDCRLWHSRQLRVCFVCESDRMLEPYEGGYVCRDCRSDLDSLALCED